MARRKKSALQQRIEYGLYRAVAALVHAASEETVHRWGSRIGSLSRRLLRSRDRLAMRNLRAAFPERDAAELRRILDECWRHFGREMLCYVRWQSLPLEEVVAHCDVENRQLIEEARSHNKGTVLVTGHWGGWEIAALVVSALVPGLHIVSRRLDNEHLERDLSRGRSQTGAVMMDRRGAARTMLKVLMQNGAVGVLPDQAVQPREGILVPFLGRPAWTTPAPAKIALRAGSTIVFVFCIPAGTRYRLVFEEPIRVDELTEEERDPVALTARINDVISRRIASRPELWLWMHDRWKGTGGSEVADVE